MTLMGNAVRAGARALFGLLALTGALSCVKEADSERASPTQTDDLVGTITVTLAAPKSLSPLAPVIESNNSVFFGGGSNVVTGTVVAMGASSGGLHAEPDALLNETWTRGPADLRDRVQVRNTLHAKTLTVGNNVTIASRDSAPVFDPTSNLAWNVTYPSGGTGPDVSVFAQQSASLTPGVYATVDVSSQANLSLRAGTYYTKSFIVESSGVVTLDQSAGPIIIYVTDTLALRGSFVVQGGAPPDLLIVNLGTTPFFVESLFDGAIVAPFTTMTLRSVNGIHTGFFAGKDFQILDAQVRVQYRAPLAILRAANPNAQTCRQLLAGLVSVTTLPAATLRYCSPICDSPADSDFDGVPDCLDGCPSDPLKTAPGMCNCGVPETDTDGDGVPDCLDQCPVDPNNTTAGECGCVRTVDGSTAGVAPAGTPCLDTACPQSGATCNGAGVCGNRTTCSPGTGCRLINWHQTSYWFCGVFPPAGGPDAGPPLGRLTESAAQLACGNKGLTLTRVNSLTENRFIDRFLTKPLWLGANDISQANTWRWSAPGTNNGDQFWSGAANGATVGNRFANWGPGAPGSLTCAVMRPEDGLWFDSDCTQSLGYVCEFRVPTVKRDGGVSPPGMPDIPPVTPCIAPADAGLPDDAAVLKQQILLASQDVFVGAAANPPPRDAATCVPSPFTNAIGDFDAGAGCAFTNIQPNSEDCLETDSSTGCARFGPQFVCRQKKDDPNCKPSDAGRPSEAGTCLGHTACGIIVCPTDNLACAPSINVCNPGTDFDAGVDPGSNLDAETYNPARLFEGGTPDAAPSPQFSDPAILGDAGKNHSWCIMKPQNPNSVQPAVQAAKNKNGGSGRGSPISFGFNPDLIFDVHANPLALGETNLGVHAQAKLVATVTLNGFLGQTFSADVINATAGITAKRCSVSDDETQFTILGLDFIDPDQIPHFNTEDPNLSPTLAGITKDCNDALANFQLWANRAKKAFRDAQQLLDQYHKLKSVIGGALNGDLCRQIGVLLADVPDFPGGNTCPTNEPIEITINRFIDYFQLPGGGQVAKLTKATSILSQFTQNLRKALTIGGTKLNLQFADIDEEESRTITNVPFAIGPVPMVLQIDAFARYGLSGNFDMEFDVPDILSLNVQAGPQQVARVGANVMPHASAGLSAFVGAGTDLGAFSATVGIEGAVSLADISAPIFAGAGLDMQVTDDFRPIPLDLKPPVSTTFGNPFQFSAPKAFRFSIHYDYGAAVDLKNILSGKIDGRLRIKFLFFSRTWRKQIVKFNGWSFHYDLISGSGNLGSVSIGQQTVPQNAANGAVDTSRSQTNVASGSSTMGLSEPQTPLMTLAYLPVPNVPDGGVPDAGNFSFDASALQGFFYDDLCCSKIGETCSAAGTPHCCTNAFCAVPAGQTSGVCQFQCKALAADCKVASDCCTSPGFRTTCGSLNTCVACAVLGTGAFCATNTDCCPEDHSTCDLVPTNATFHQCIQLIP